MAQNAQAVADPYTRAARVIGEAISPSYYASARGLPVYLWQHHVLDCGKKRVIVNGARQGGKSTTIVTRPCWRAKHYPGSLSIIGAAVEKQAVEDIEKCKDLLGHDPEVEITRTSDELIYLANGSRILVVPATEKSFRGYSQPDELVLDEASRIDDDVYSSGVIAMLTNNPKCVLTMLSTPNGREGFFYRAWKSTRWERFEVTSPWDVIDDTWDLVPAIPEKEFRLHRLLQGIHGYYSPRHQDFAEQKFNLGEMGPRMYRQEYKCEFVESMGQLFKYADIEYLRSTKGVTLPAAGLVKSGLPAFVFDDERN